MDPLSILSLVEACAGLAVTAGKLAIGLKSLADNYKKASLTFRSLSSQCRLFSTAVRAIQGWMEEAPEVTTIDDRIWEQLADSLECANDAIYALENELVSSSGSSVNTFWEKAGVVWNLQTMRELEDCIHKQISSLSVILQIMNLPTRQSQKNSLAEKSSVFQDSRSSATSVRDAETSTLRAGGDGASTMRAPSTIMTTLSQLPQFDFDDMLLTSQVYLRNRNKTLALNTKSSSNGKMKDAETSVSEWEFGPKKFIVNGQAYVGDHVFDLKEAAQYIDRGDALGIKLYLQTTLIHQHETLQSKYSKVKRYYFEKENELQGLQHEISILRSGNPDEHAAFLKQIDERSREELERQVAEVRARATRLEQDNALLRGAAPTSTSNADLAKLKDQVDWYKNPARLLAEQLFWCKRVEWKYSLLGKYAADTANSIRCLSTINEARSGLVTWRYSCS